MPSLAHCLGWIPMRSMSFFVFASFQKQSAFFFTTAVWIVLVNFINHQTLGKKYHLRTSWPYLFRNVNSHSFLDDCPSL